MKLDEPKQVEFTIDKIVQSRRFTETKWTKLLAVRSKLLSKFHARDVMMRASVTLPASYYEKKDRRYPVIYQVPGFGGTHHGRARRQPLKERNNDGVEFIRVVLDPTSPLGHHVFADSANNGPVGKALISEFIPRLEKKYRGIGKPYARLLTGHSSGGWSSLWLQVTYPDFFGGTWSTAPDPVDFRDFQQINMYEPKQNLYRNRKGKTRPLARMRGRVILTFPGFDSMEWTVGPGGQLHSFEAVFSPRGDDGKPQLAWDRKTGKVNRKVVEHWKKYDIRLIMETNWKTLGPKLKGKIHVIMGGADTFYLDGASRLLKKSLAKLSDDPVVEIYEGKTHFDLMTRKLRKRIYDEMVEAVKKGR